MYKVVHEEYSTSTPLGTTQALRLECEISSSCQYTDVVPYPVFLVLRNALRNPCDITNLLCNQVSECPAAGAFENSREFETYLLS